MSERGKLAGSGEAVVSETTAVETAETTAVETAETTAVETAETTDGSGAGAAGDAGIGSAGGEEPETIRERIDSILESLLLAAGSPLPLRRMVEILGGPSPKEVKAALARLMEEYSGQDRGFHLAAVAEGYQFRTVAANATWVRAMLRERPARLGRAALETLSIVAYKQPVTRAEVEAIRGVDADSAIGTLLARKLIKITGRKEAVGRPLLYATTQEFLAVFGLMDLKDLPVLREIGPVPEPDDEAASEDGDNTWGAAAEDSEPSGNHLAAGGGSADPGGAGVGERPGGDGAGDEGESEAGPDRG